MSALDLGQVPLTEDQYAADLELLDRYTGFSSELVRLASLGLGGLAVFLQSSFDKEAKAAADEVVGFLNKLQIGWFNLLLGGAALLFAIAIACGLLHRYYATDGLACHIRSLRMTKRSDDGAETEAVECTNRYKLASSWLISGECAVAAGAFVAGVAFAIRFSILNIDWRSAVVLASLAILGAVGISGYRWWSKWHEVEEKRAAQPKASTGEPRKKRDAAG